MVSCHTVTFRRNPLLPRVDGDTVSGLLGDLRQALAGDRGAADRVAEAWAKQIKSAKDRGDAKVWYSEKLRTWLAGKLSPHTIRGRTRTVVAFFDRIARVHASEGGDLTMPSPARIRESDALTFLSHLRHETEDVRAAWGTWATLESAASDGERAVAQWILAAAAKEPNRRWSRAEILEGLDGDQVRSIVDNTSPRPGFRSKGGTAADAVLASLVRKGMLTRELKITTAKGREVDTRTYKDWLKATRGKMGPYDYASCTYAPVRPKEAAARPGTVEQRLSQLKSFWDHLGKPMGGDVKRPSGLDYNPWSDLLRQNRAKTDDDPARARMRRPEASDLVKVIRKLRRKQRPPKGSPMTVRSILAYRDELLVTMLVLTALRVSELCRLRKKDTSTIVVNEEQYEFGKVTAKGRQGGKLIEVPISDRVFQALQRLEAAIRQYLDHWDPLIEGFRADAGPDARPTPELGKAMYYRKVFTSWLMTPEAPFVPALARWGNAIVKAHDYGRPEMIKSIENRKDLRDAPLEKARAKDLPDIAVPFDDTSVRDRLHAIAGRGEKNHAMRLRLHPHGFRHLAADLAEQGGSGVQLAQALLGHSDSRTTDIYRHTEAVKVQSMKAVERRWDTLIASLESGAGGPPSAPGDEGPDSGPGPDGGGEEATPPAASGPDIVSAVPPARPSEPALDIESEVLPSDLLPPGVKDKPAKKRSLAGKKARERYRKNLAESPKEAHNAAKTATKEQEPSPDEPVLGAIGESKLPPTALDEEIAASPPGALPSPTVAPPQALPGAKARTKKSRTTWAFGDMVLEKNVGSVFDLFDPRKRSHEWFLPAHSASRRLYPQPMPLRSSEIKALLDHGYLPGPPVITQSGLPASWASANLWVGYRTLLPYRVLSGLRGKGGFRLPGDPGLTKATVDPEKLTPNAVALHKRVCLPIVPVDDPEWIASLRETLRAAIQDTPGIVGTAKHVAIKRWVSAMLAHSLYVLVRMQPAPRWIESDETINLLAADWRSTVNETYRTTLRKPDKHDIASWLLAEGTTWFGPIGQVFDLSGADREMLRAQSIEEKIGDQVDKVLALSRDDQLAATEAMASPMALGRYPLPDWIVHTDDPLSDPTYGLPPSEVESMKQWLRLMHSRATMDILSFGSDETLSSFWPLVQAFLRSTDLTIRCPAPLETRREEVAAMYGVDPILAMRRFLRTIWEMRRSAPSTFAYAGGEAPYEKAMGKAWLLIWSWILPEPDAALGWLERVVGKRLARQAAASAGNEGALGVLADMASLTQGFALSQSEFDRVLSRLDAAFAALAASGKRKDFDRAIAEVEKDAATLSVALMWSYYHPNETLASAFVAISEDFEKLAKERMAEILPRRKIDLVIDASDETGEDDLEDDIKKVDAFWAKIALGSLDSFRKMRPSWKERDSAMRSMWLSDYGLPDDWSSLSTKEVVDRLSRTRTLVLGTRAIFRAIAAHRGALAEAEGLSQKHLAEESVLEASLLTPPDPHSTTEGIDGQVAPGKRVAIARHAAEKAEERLELVTGTANLSDKENAAMQSRLARAMAAESIGEIKEDDYPRRAKVAEMAMREVVALLQEKAAKNPKDKRYEMVAALVESFDRERERAKERKAKPPLKRNPGGGSAPGLDRLVLPGAAVLPSMYIDSVSLLFLFYAGLPTRRRD